MPCKTAGMFGCMLPGFGRFRKVLLTVFTVLLHTSWVSCGEEGTAEGFGFAGGTGGFGFVTLESRCSRYIGDQWNVRVQMCVLLFTGLDASGGKGLDGGRGFPWVGKKIQPRIFETQPSKAKPIIVLRNKITNISKFCMQLTSTQSFEGGANDLTI